MIEIKQGKPRHPYFVLAWPTSKPVRMGDHITCRDPKSGEVTQGVCKGVYTEKWTDVPDSWCLLTYGVKAQVLKVALEKKFKAHHRQDSVKFLLIRERDKK